MSLDRRKFLGAAPVVAAAAVVPARPETVGAFAWRKIESVDDLPEPGKYVLVLYNGSNWGDREDPRGVYIKTAKLVRGITLAEREQMKRGEIPSPEPELLWNLVDGHTRHERWEIYRDGDEQMWGSGGCAWSWREFGPGGFDARSVDWWAPIPELPVDAR